MSGTGDAVADAFDPHLLLHWLPSDPDRRPPTDARWRQALPQPMRVVQKYGCRRRLASPSTPWQTGQLPRRPQRPCYLRAPHSRHAQDRGTAAAGPPNTGTPPRPGQLRIPLHGDPATPDHRRMAVTRMAGPGRLPGSTGTADQACRRCPVRAPCLAAAIAIDDPAEWRGGIHRDERDVLWENSNRRSSPCVTTSSCAWTDSSTAAAPCRRPETSTTKRSRSPST